MSFLQKFRERVNLAIYDRKETVLAIFRLANIFVSLIGFGTLVYFYGYRQTPESTANCLLVIESGFIFYILHYFIRFFFDFEPGKFLRQNWLEGCMMAVLFIEGLTYNLFDKMLIQSFFESVGFFSFKDLSAIFIQVFFFFVVMIEVTRTYKIIPYVKFHPAVLFLLSFILIILAGTGLLMLPEMTTIEGSMSFVDALFTSTSATCVTGLSVVDPATFFTFKGQVVIMMLIMVGGLNIVGFVAFIVLMSKFGIGVKYHSFMDDYARKGTIESALKMLKKIVLCSFVIEFIGAFLFYIFMGDNNPLTPTEGDRVFASMFHSVSAFNNAGFSIFTNGLYNEHVSENYFMHIDIMLLIFFGSLGFMVMFDIFSVENLRERMRKPWKRISFNSKIALYFALILVFGGAILFYVFEYDNTLKDKNTGEAIITSLFQSITTRTAGYNTVDIGALTMPVIIIFLFLMFVGASSGSTGGGIKTSTFAILWASTIATMREKKNVELFKRTILQDTVLKAFTVLLFFIVWNMVSIILLSVTETEILHTPGRSIADIIFEQVSAFGTVGLSTGITPALTVEGKLIITFSMFMGKIGALTVAYLLGRKVISTNYKYPHADAVVG
ncbi:MAG: TrkH family potassium uptake protein [Bacteroidota bacterium]